MKILLIADAEQASAFCSLGTDSSVELIVTDNMEALPVADVCIALLYAPGSQDDVLVSLDMPLILNSVTHVLSDLPAGAVRIAGWKGWLEKPVIEATGDPEQHGYVEQVMAFFNKKVQWVADTPGMISPRIIAKIINEARLAEAEGVSTRDEINTAMKLGTNYPMGPFEWEALIGSDQIDELLNA